MAYGIYYFLRDDFAAVKQARCGRRGQLSAAVGSLDYICSCVFGLRANVNWH